MSTAEIPSPESDGPAQLNMKITRPSGERTALRRAHLIPNIIGAAYQIFPVVTGFNKEPVDQALADTNAAIGNHSQEPEIHFQYFDVALPGLDPEQHETLSIFEAAMVTPELAQIGGLLQNRAVSNGTYRARQMHGYELAEGFSRKEWKKQFPGKPDDLPDDLRQQYHTLDRLSDRLGRTTEFISLAAMYIAQDAGEQALAILKNDARFSELEAGVLGSAIATASVWAAGHIDAGLLERPKPFELSLVTEE